MGSTVSGVISGVTFADCGVRFAAASLWRSARWGSRPRIGLWERHIKCRVAPSI
jgi:hypothetical protein